MGHTLMLLNTSRCITFELMGWVEILPSNSPPPILKLSLPLPITWLLPCRIPKHPPLIFLSPFLVPAALAEGTDGIVH